MRYVAQMHTHIQLCHVIILVHRLKCNIRTQHGITSRNRYHYTRQYYHYAVTWCDIYCMSVKRVDIYVYIYIYIYI